MATKLLPNVELLATEWLKSLEGLPSDKISTNLPAPDVVAQEGFITVQAVGGIPHPETRMQASEVQVDCWGYNENSNKLPWARTFHKAMLIKQAIEVEQNFVVVTAGQYLDALVRSVIVASDFRRVPGDPTFARYSADIVLYWTMLNKEA